jgi:hypothetical protein
MSAFTLDQSVSGDQIKKLLHAMPFVPFKVHVAAEQKAYEIPHPDFAMLTHGGRVLVVALEHAEAVHLISVPLIIRIEASAAPA